MNIHAGWTREICRAGIQFRGVGRPITKGGQHRFGLLPPPVICQIPGIYASASVIVLSLPPYRMGLEEG